MVVYLRCHGELPYFSRTNTDGHCDVVELVELVKCFVFLNSPTSPARLTVRRLEDCSTWQGRTWHQWLKHIRHQEDSTYCPRTRNQKLGTSKQEAGTRRGVSHVVRSWTLNSDVDVHVVVTLCTVVHITNFNSLANLISGVWCYGRCHWWSGSVVRSIPTCTIKLCNFYSNILLAVTISTRR